jgi:hypothetical protein
MELKKQKSQILLPGDREPIGVTAELPGYLNDLEIQERTRLAAKVGHALAYPIKAATNFIDRVI